MNHPSQQDLLGYLDGRLSSDRFDEVDQHLTSCEDCETAMELLEASSDTLVALLKEGANAEAWAKDTVVPDTASPSGHSSPPTQHSREFGDYELIEEIARGGMGVVFKARQKKANRVVALKMILAGHLAGRDDVDRFYAEAEAAANLDHPNIVPVFDVGEVDGNHYFSMAFIDGQSLSALVRDEPLEPRYAAELMVKVANAVEYAHSRQIIHRDLKPANIMMESRDVPRVTDFGLAKRIESDSGLTASGQVMGTPSYMPPEQALGDVAAIGKPADVYSLGAVLYCLVTGRPPFRAASMLETLDQVVKDDPVPPARLNKAVDVDLDTIILKALSKPQHQRYESAAAFAEDLTRFIENRPVKARRVSAFGRLSRWAKRNRLLATILFSVAIGLLVVSGVASYAAVVYRQMAIVEQGLRAEVTNNLYVAEMNSVDDVLSDPELSQMSNSNLHEWNPMAPKPRVPPGSQDPRGWEWFFLLGLTDNDRIGIPGIVPCVDVGTQERFAFGFKNNLALIKFNQPGGGILWNAHSKTIRAVRFSSDGNTLATGSDDGTIKLWDVASRQSSTSLEHGAAVGCVAFNDSASVLVSHGVDGVLKIWDCEAKTVLHTISGVSKFPACHVSADGKTVAVIGFDENSFPLRLYNMDSGELETSIRDHVHNDTVTCIHWNPRGTQLATSSLDRTTKIWNVKDETLVLDIDTLDQPINAVAFHPDGTQFVTVGADTGAYIWDATTGRQVRILGRLGGKHYGATGVAWSPDAKVIITAAGAAFEYHWLDHGSIRKLQMESVGRSAPVASLAWHPSKVMASATCGHSSVDWISEQPQQLPSNPESLLCWSSDGTLAASIRNDRLVVQRGDKVILDRAFPQPVTGLHWSGDTSAIAIQQTRQITVIHDVNNPASAVTIAPQSTAQLTDMCWSHDNKLLVIGSDSGDVGIYEATTGKLDISFRINPRDEQVPVPTAVCWRPGTDTFVIGTGDNYLQRYDYSSLPRETGSNVPNKKLFGHQAAIRDLAWNTEGTRLASASVDRKVHVWQLSQMSAGSNSQQVTSANNQKLVKVLTIPHTSDVRAVQWHRDGRHLASLTDRGTVTIFDSTPGHEEMERIKKDPDSVDWED